MPGLGDNSLEEPGLGSKADFEVPGFGDKSLEQPGFSLKSVFDVSAFELPWSLFKVSFSVEELIGGEPFSLFEAWNLLSVFLDKC